MIPQAKNDLVDLMAFIELMKTDYETGKFEDWQTFIEPIRKWYTSQRLDEIDEVVMGWKKMATYANQQNLIHLTAALVSLLRLPEYQELTPEQQNIALWIVLYHDVEKENYKGKRDHTHGFRSAGICGRGLIQHGFEKAVDEEALNQWISLTQTAMIYDETLQDNIQDNSKLDAVIQGIDGMFGSRDSPSGLIVCGVLLHMSIDVVDEFPQSAPLTDDEIRAYISPTLFPLLRVMMFTDNAAWALFDPERQAPERQQTRRAFDRVEALLGNHNY